MPSRAPASRQRHAQAPTLAARERRYERRWHSIDPEGSFRSKWDLAQAIILAYIALTVPFRVGLKQPAEGPSYWVELLIDLYFWFDIAFNFCTGYEAEEEEGVIVYHPKLIRANYIKTWFTIDLLACLPVDLALRATEGTLECSMEVDGCDAREEDGTGQLFKLFKLLRLFRLVKLLRLFRVSRLLHRYQNQLIYYHSFISVARVNGLVVLIAHWMGCIYGMNYEQNLDNNSSNRWLQSIYWAVQSITSVGYGDMPADNEITMLIAIFTMLMGVVLCSWIMTNVLAAMNPATDVGKKDLPPALRSRFTELYVDEMLDAADLQVGDV